MKKSKTKATVTGEVTGEVDEFDIDVKRFYIPGIVIKAPCPKCGGEATLDLSEDYLSYPKANVPESVTLWCREEDADGNPCEAEVEVSIRVNVTVEAL